MSWIDKPIYPERRLWRHMSEFFFKFFMQFLHHWRHHNSCKKSAMYVKKLLLVPSERRPNS